MTDESTKLLCEAVIGQVVDDYRELKRRNLGWIGSESDGNFSLPEIEHFLRSGWCGAMLHAIDSKVDGVTILRQLKSETAKA